MTTKLPTISIQGKEYVLVKDRIAAFNENFPNGCIQTELISKPEDSTVVVKATVIPDCSLPARSFSSHSQAIVGGTGVNKTAAMENADTSAVGRALAYMGIGVIESVASADEIRKATPKSAPIGAARDKGETTKITKEVVGPKTGEVLACAGDTLELWYAKATGDLKMAVKLPGGEIRRWVNDDNSYLFIRNSQK